MSPPSEAERRPTQTGIASWYGPAFHGRTTASGAIYDQNKLTAAHQTLPLGSQVMVTNLDNGRSIVVTINDRGPFVKGRIIDLSRAAARALDMIARGTVPVRVEVITSGRHTIRTIPQHLDYTVQVGSFTEMNNAQKLQDKLAETYPEVSIVPVQAKDEVYYRVQLGTFASRRNAEFEAHQLGQRGFLAVIMEK
ncbi:MAG: septal ring lytic transglycosylase RlpA family protein [Candidatus Binatia bacterium]